MGAHHLPSGSNWSLFAWGLDREPAATPTREPDDSMPRSNGTSQADEVHPRLRPTCQSGPLDLRRSQTPDYC